MMALFSAALISHPAAQGQTGSSADGQPTLRLSRPRKPAARNDEDGQQRTREAWLWHEVNRQRLARHGLDAVGPEVNNADTNDISVLQDDGTLITPPNQFDLVGRAVQFTPSGSGYTVTSTTGNFDTNFGTKLDLTTSPAVNPKLPDAEPGDDAYILQSLGFSFSFYGTSYTSVAVSSNGNLVFRPAGISNAAFNDGAVSSLESLDELTRGLPRIAAFWHDLDAKAANVQGSNGIYLRRDSDRVLVTYNNIRDFQDLPSDPAGVQRFQITLFSDGRILFTYSSIQLLDTALAGISPGNASNLRSVDLDNPPSGAITLPIAEFFATDFKVDTIGVVQAFYATHPNRDVYDFIYLVTDFSSSLGVTAFAFYEPFRNDISGIGQPTFDGDPTGLLGARRVQGLLDLSDISTSYPDYPTDIVLGAEGVNSALSIMGQEQGHRWLAYVLYPGADPNLLLGRAKQHWSFFFNIESTLSTPAARRASSMEGNVWRDNGNGSFTSLTLTDGYSRLDQYAIGLRPSTEVPDTFVITNPTGSHLNSDAPQPGVTLNGTKQTVTIDQIIQANGPRSPGAAAAPKSFRSAVVLLVKQGTQPSAATLSKVTRFRLAWESYFGQSTDYLGSFNTGLSDTSTSRVIAAASAASFVTTLSPAGIVALFGTGLTDGSTQVATVQPLPTTLAGTQVLINGTPAPLFFAAPGQINFELPRTTTATTSIPALPTLQSRTVTIEIVNNGQLIRAGAMLIAPAAPAIFTFNQSGSGPAAAVDAFAGTLAPFAATRADGSPNIISVFGTGLGADATDVGGVNVSGNVQVTIDGNPVTVGYAGPAPGFIGLNQLNVTLPAGISSGNHTLVVTRNGVPSNGVTIAIR